MVHRTLATTYALGRVGVGAALVLAPGLLGRAWVGRAGAQPGTRVVTTAMGARDAALGLGLLEALRGGRDPGPWLLAGAFADAADLLAMFRGREDVPAPAFAGVGALAGGAAVLGAYLARAAGQSVP
jgi:hypothetical protein